MQRFINLDSSHKLHSLLLQHHVNKQSNGVESADFHPPIVSPPQPGKPSQPVFTMNNPVTSPIFTPMFQSPDVTTKPAGIIKSTFANLFARKGANE